MKPSLILTILFVTGAMAKTWKQGWKYKQKLYRCHENKDCIDINMGCSPHETACLGGACGCPYYWVTEKTEDGGLGKSHKDYWDPKKLAEQFIECDEDEECIDVDLGCAPYINGGKTRCLGEYCTCPRISEIENERAYGKKKNYTGVGKLYSCKEEKQCASKKYMLCSPDERTCERGWCRCPWFLPNQNKNKKGNNNIKPNDSEKEKANKTRNDYLKIFIECDEDEECINVDLGCASFINGGKPRCLGDYCTCPRYLEIDNERAYGKKKNETGVNKLYHCKEDKECATKKYMSCSPDKRTCERHWCRCPWIVPRLNNNDRRGNDNEKENDNRIEKKTQGIYRCKEDNDCKLLPLGCYPLKNSCSGGYCGCSTK